MEGTITSTAKVARDYVVTVSWINETSDVLARGIAVVEALEPSASQDFQLSTEVPEGASVCTFNVMRGTIKS
ncbi:MAG: hypothetical protein HZY75_12760 [Nocardioidaceae bacterium]|nr:MAG: hypothetical protein HZY75_12760 [Nocardioidaceae bacterium]